MSIRETFYGGKVADRRKYEKKETHVSTTEQAS